MERVIVSRHPAAIQFIKQENPKFANAPVLDSASSEDVLGKEVAGNLPLHLAALAYMVWAIEFKTPPRGQEYTLADMYASGAHLKAYTVVDVCAYEGIMAEEDDGF